MSLPDDRVLGYAEPPADFGGGKPLIPQFPQAEDRFIAPYHIMVPWEVLITRYGIERARSGQARIRARWQKPVDKYFVQQFSVRVLLWPVWIRSSLWPGWPAV